MFKSPAFRWFALLSLVIITILLWTKMLQPEERLLKIVFLDVGQGDSIFIEAPNGNQVLIDGGPNKKVLSSLGKIMPFYDRSLDIVIGTHPDTDHIGGLIDIIKNYRVKTFLDPKFISDGRALESLLGELEKNNVQYLTAESGQKIFLDEDIFLEVLYPYSGYTQDEANEASIVLKLIFNESEVLLTGDASRFIELSLVNIFGEYLQSDILKVGHHGSRTSTSQVFLNQVRPRYAIISASCGNSFGHPHKEVVKSLENGNIEILSTCESGNIIFYGDGERFYLED